MIANLLTPYEARCAAYWLHFRYGYNKKSAALGVDRGNQNPQIANVWFYRFVLDGCKESHLQASKRWKDKHRKENRERDVNFARYKKTPYYQALKRDVGDLRVLKNGQR